MFSIPTALWVPAVILWVAAVFDMVTRRIPDTLSILLVLWAIISRIAGFQAPDWAGAGLGLGLGLGLGFAFFSLGWLGGGDGKLLAGLGAILGPIGLLAVLPWMAAAGGIVALWTRMRRPEEKEIAYGPAIAVGYLVALLA